jgi:hypothetical protein
MSLVTSVILLSIYGSKNDLNLNFGLLKTCSYNIKKKHYG